jgi:hypothetical protein
MKKFLIGILKVFGWVTLFIVVYLGLVLWSVWAT